MSLLALLPEFFNRSFVVGAESDESSDSLEECMGSRGLLVGCSGVDQVEP